jgi:gluconolactonase
MAFESLEGPFWMAGPQTLLFSDVVEQNGGAAKIYRYSPAANTFAVEPYPVTPTSTNGLGADPQGHLIACERWNGALVRVADGRRIVLADAFPPAGEWSLAAPNDVIVRSDGNIYFSDTQWGAKPGTHAAQAVYRVAPDGHLTVAGALSMPNGVALSPDERTLYVGSDAQNLVWKLPVDAAGATGAATVLVDASHVPGGLFKVPDGICIDDAGKLYIANNDEAVKAIEVFTPEGDYLGDIAIADRPSNCTFGGKDRQTLYVTTSHAVYAAKVTTPGLP